uniref:Uncharacterized protein n=1 Tax=Arcella intermedia TaxID=1963864 RepID=A0A6B2LTD8_9EUKA
MPTDTATDTGTDTDTARRGTDMATGMGTGTDTGMERRGRGTSITTLKVSRRACCGSTCWELG